MIRTPTAFHGATAADTPRATTDTPRALPRACHRLFHGLPRHVAERRGGPCHLPRLSPRGKVHGNLDGNLDGKTPWDTTASHGNSHDNPHRAKRPSRQRPRERPRQHPRKVPPGSIHATPTETPMATSTAIRGRIHRIPWLTGASDDYCCVGSVRLPSDNSSVMHTAVNPSPAFMRAIQYRPGGILMVPVPKGTSIPRPTPHRCAKLQVSFVPYVRTCSSQKYHKHCFHVAERYV